jgi:hypothetical protein
MGAMMHRHLNHQDFTLAAIDDVIGRGRLADWDELRSALARFPELRAKVLRVCNAHVADPYAQRYYFWKHYVEARADAA